MAKIKVWESQNVEYKSGWHAEYLKWICGFANVQGATVNAEENVLVRYPSCKRYNYIRKIKNHCRLKRNCIFAVLKFIVFFKSFKSWNLIKY